jgi:quercetin dioxygenase-like cupin family protein
MKIIREDEGETTVSKTISGFGELVSLLPPQRDGGIKLALVRFKDGARTHWHEHPGEQVLYILEGEGWVGTETDEWVVMPGDLVYTGSGERHWHGASPGKSMTHISITNIGPPHWYEEVE